VLPEIEEGLTDAASGPVESEDPIGPADAPVRLTVFYEAQNPCHEFIVPESKKLAARYEPHVRVEFAAWHASGTAQLASELSVGCLVSISVTGPMPEESVEPATVTFTGPTEIGAWNWDEVGDAIEARLIVAGVDPTPKLPEADEEIAETG
jgi:hypothetical protein